MSEFLAEASVLIRPNTAAFRATLIAELAASTKGIVVPVSVAAGSAAGVKGVSTAQAELAAATKTATVAQTKQVSVQELGAATARAETAALKAKERQLIATATKQEQFARGAGATGLTTFGLRGATLAASEPFLLGAAAVTVFAKSIQEASAETEAAARANKIFGDSTEQLTHDAEGFASTVGVSVTEALKFEGAIGNILTVSGVAHEKIPQLSEDLVKLGTDMAAFNNVPLEQTLKAIQLGLVGNSRGLRAYGVELNAAAVNEEALVESGKANTAELTRQDRVQARIAILFRQTVNQQGAAADRAKDLAGQTRILSAEITNLGAELGKMAFGPAVAAVGAINDLVTAASHLRSVADLVTGGQKSAAHGFSISALAARAYQEELRFLVSPLGDFQRGLNAALGLLIKTPSETATAQEAWVSLRLSIKAFNEEIAAMLAQTGKINFARATAELGKLQDKFLDLQFKGASPSARIANLQAQLQEQLSIIANPPTVKAKTTAKEQRNAIQNQINQILDDQKRAAEDTAQKAQDVASSIAQIAQDAKDKVQELLAEADQAFLDALSVREGAFDIRQAKVEATKSLVDDIAFQQDLERFLKASIVKASTISDAKKKADTIQQLTLALVQAQNAEKALIAAQKQAVADRQATKIANQGASIDLDIEFAQTTKNISAEKRAHEAKIKFLTDQENHAKRGTNEWKQLRNQIAQENAAIAELNKQVNDRNNAAKSLAFDMLVTQEGFAANLISNLIPGGATAGLVGGGAISTPTVAGSGGPSRPPDVGAELGAAVQTSGGPQPATSGQLGALLDIQRRQLAVLEQLFGRTGHPEATAQKAGAAAAMNTVPW